MPSKLLNLKVESSDIWRNLAWDKKFLLWPLGVGQRLTRWEKVSNMTWKFLSWATALHDGRRWAGLGEMMRSVLDTMLHLPSVFYKYKSLPIDWQKKRNLSGSFRLQPQSSFINAHANSLIHSFIHPLIHSFSNPFRQKGIFKNPDSRDCLGSKPNSTSSFPHPPWPWASNIISWYLSFLISKQEW